MSAHDIANDGEGRTIGNGVVVAYVAAVAADVTLVLFADLDAFVGMVVFLAMLLVVIASDLYIQRLDATGKGILDGVAAGAD